MQLLIDRPAGLVTVNGTQHKVDCSSVPLELAMVRWFDDHGELHYADGRTTGLAGIQRFHEILRLWDDAHKASKMATR